ncbi:MAG: sodium:solute symporter family protein [Candidatus Palauibacterales bacterium]|nr:sodium:solute symporter family protein [Candidatus Palauibacterales bacterium]
MTLLDWLIVGGYLAAAVGIGVAMARRGGRSVLDYFVSGRALPWWLAGTSMVATTFAVDTPLAVTELVVQHGVAGNWLWWNLLMSGMLTVFFYARLWRRAEVMTDVEFTEIRYSGKPAALLRGFRALYLAVPINLIVMGWVNLAMAEVLAVTLDVPRLWALGICFALAGGYALLSGLWGVVLADFLQFFLAVGGSVVLAFFAVDAVGGMGALAAGVRDAFGPGAEPLAFFPSGDRAWMPAITLAVYLGVNWWASWYPGAEPGGGGYIAQRIFSSRSEEDGLLATLWFNVAHYALRPWPWILVGLATVILYPELENPRQGYVRAVVDLLPPGLTGVMIAAFAAAYMSTISTMLNWGASYLVGDIYRRFVRPEAEEKELVRVSRLSTLGLMAGSLVVTAFLGSIEGAWRFLLAIGAGTGLVLILRWYWWRINAWSEISAMVASLGASLWLWFGAGLDPDVPREWAYVMLGTVAVSTVVWLAVTFLTEPEDEETLVSFYRRVRPGGRGWAPVARAAGLEPEPIPGGMMNWANWLAGVVGVYSVLFGTGKALFGEWGAAALWLAAGAISLGWIVRSLRSGAALAGPRPGEEPRGDPSGGERREDEGTGAAP